MDNGENVPNVNINGYISRSSTPKPNSAERQYSAARQAWLEQCKNILSDEEKANETITTLQNEVARLRDEVSVKNDDYERHTKRIGDLEKQLMEKNSELDSMKTRLGEVLRLNENLGAKNQEMENFRAGLEMYIHITKRPMIPLTLQGGSTANQAAAVGSPGIQNPPAATVTYGVPAVILTPPVSEQYLPADEINGDTPPQVAIMEPHVSWSSLDTSSLSSVPSTSAGKRKHAESSVKAYICKKCMVAYQYQPELSIHTCPGSVHQYRCRFAGCGRTFTRDFNKKRHEKACDHKRGLSTC